MSWGKSTSRRWLMLVLLVVFIVTAPLLTNAVHVNLPETAETAPPEEKDAVYVSVDAQGKVFIDKQELVEAVENESKTRQAANPELASNLNADAGCSTASSPRLWDN